MLGGNYQGHQSMKPGANQGLPQHNAKHFPVRTFKEIGDAPEYVSFASDYPAACWMPMKATKAWYKVLDLEGHIISRVHRTRTLWSRRHCQPPTIELPEHNDGHEWSTSAQSTGCQRLNKPAAYLVVQIMRKTMPSHDAGHSTYKTYQNMIRKSVTHSFSRKTMRQASIKAAETLCRALDLQHVRVGPKLYNRQRTFQSEWRTGNARYQSAVSQEHDARRQLILRLPRHDAKYFTYRTWVFHRWVNRSPTYHVVQDNAMGYGKKPIIRSTRAQCWTPAGGATARHQAFDLHNVRVAPMNEFSTHQSRQGDARRQS